MRWGKITERGCYTLTKKIKKKLRDVANRTQMPESEHVRNALNLYFKHLETQTNHENPSQDT